MTRHTIALSLVLAALAAPAFAQNPGKAAEVNRKIGRAVNLGNALEAPKEGEWGMVLRAEYFDLIKQAGFTAVRIPTKWSAHAAKEAPYTIDPAFAERVDWAVDQALSKGLAVVLNIHHFDEMDGSPGETLPRFLGLWDQIARRYKDKPDTLVFELMNEPHDKLTDELWNDVVPQALKVVRASNPGRTVIVGPGHWNGVGSLPKLELPADDRNLIVTVHYYLPFKFTHQGASWVKDSEPWLGTTWEGKPEELAALRKDFDAVASWAKANDRPIFLGEFGAFSRAPENSRLRWTAAIAREAEARGFSWAYWEFGAGFGIYDRDKEAWRTPLRDALIPPAGRP